MGGRSALSIIDATAGDGLSALSVAGTGRGDGVVVEATVAVDIR